jgi:SAM-dependent methyltransferase
VTARSGGLLPAVEHYEALLAEHYTRMCGGFEPRVAADQALLARLVAPPAPGADRAVDLGCGPGFQAVALARLGFRVTAVDLSRTLLAELGRRAAGLPVTPRLADVRAVEEVAPEDAAVIVCMGDTLAHLERREDVDVVLRGCARRLRPGGRLVLGFRDQSAALEGLDRIVPVRAEDDLLVTCVLDYEPEWIVVQDVIHVREATGWTIRKGRYRKLRLDPAWVRSRVAAAGLAAVHEEASRGLVTLVAARPVDAPSRDAPAARGRVPADPDRAAARRGPALAGLAAVLLLGAGPGATALAQTPPSASERAAYTGLLAAAARGDAAGIAALAARGERPDVRDGLGRTPLHVAAHGGHHAAMRALAAAGADPNALDAERYDAVTIAAVAGDVPTLETALALGGRPGNVTSRYDGTALIAAAHLGHAEVVRALIRAGAPLDHVNNLGWTALIEAIVLGDGGPRHTATLRALVEAGADVNLPDRAGRTPLALARERGHAAMVDLLRQAGAR